MEYQAQLDRVKTLGTKPEANPVLGVQSSWDRTDLMETARKEIDTMGNLSRCCKALRSRFSIWLHTRGRDHHALGPNLRWNQHKNVMNEHLAMRCSPPPSHRAPNLDGRL